MGEQLDVDLSAVVNPWQALVVVTLVLAVLVGPQVGSWITSYRGARDARRAAEEITHQSNPNSGQSMKDYLVRIEGKVDHNTGTLADLARRVDRLERRPWWARR